VRTGKLAMLDEAITQLRLIRASADRDDKLKELIDARDGVLARYQPIFSQEALSNLSAGDFQSFLLFKNNHHWTGLHRKGPQICENLEGLRAALLGLHNQSRPIAERVDAALDGVNYLGKGTLTAVLHVMYPADFGVWNRTSEDSLKKLQAWPMFGHGASPGKRYAAINDVLRQLAAALGVDLWVLDALLWRAAAAADPAGMKHLPSADPVIAEDEPDLEQKFGLEKYLHEFLRDNWSGTELGKNWTIYVDAGEDAGFKYSCGSLGQIDLLARHKNGRDWLVVELKRDQSGDATVGQLLRYMGFVRYNPNLAAETDRVFGLIIAHSLDEKLHYAVSNVPNVAVHTYQVDFRLGPPTKGGQQLPFKLLTLSDLETSV